MYLHLISLLSSILLSDPFLHEIKNETFAGNISIAKSHAQYCFDSRLRAGQCLPLSECPAIIEEYYREKKNSVNNADFQTFVSNSICGFDGSNFLICCSQRVSNSLEVVPQNLQTLMTMPPALSLTAGGSYNAAQAPVPTTFKFSPLGGGYVIVPTTIAMVTLPPIATSGPIIFQPVPVGAVLPTASTSTTTAVFQPTPPSSAPSASLSTFDPVPAVTIVADPGSAAPVLAACGISKGSTNRVVGGQEAKRGAYPWIAALGYRDEINPSSLKFLCSGSLISIAHIVTSAHCINQYITLVRLGAHDLSKATENEAQDYRIKRTIVHEQFNMKSISNDIALIQLEQQVTMTDSISIICLPESSRFLTENFVGMNPFVAGWGATKHQSITSPVLRDVQVPIVDRQTCEQNYRTIFNFVEFSDKLICAGNSNVDACQGDSGGPLMLPQLDGTTYRFYLLGIVSYGYECARTGFPGVYTRVAAYLPWIKTHLL